jgi:hypothetical protein
MWKIAKQTNGTQAKICQIVLNRGVTPFLVSVDGIMVRGAFASQVNHLRLEHVGKPGKFFNVESKKFTGMTVKMPVSTELSSREANYSKKDSKKLKITVKEFQNRFNFF